MRASSEDNFLKRIEEHEEQDFTDDHLEEVAKQAFALDDEQPANPWHGVASPSRK
jgi:hypothetical protein